MTGDVDKATIIGGSGNDTVYFDNADGRNIFRYNEGDGDDVIYSFQEADTLLIGDSSGTYSTQVSGSDMTFNINSINYKISDSKLVKK